MRRAAIAALVALTAVSCQREKRGLHPEPADRVVAGLSGRQSDILPGGGAVAAQAASTNPPTSSPFAGNAYAISQGQQLFSWYNCTGCHANGGGAIGPSLMDQNWTYGGSPDKIFESIAKGRKNGMPAWGGRIPEYQIWQLVAFVRSLSGGQPKAATPPRSDNIERNPATILEGPQKRPERR